MLDSFAIGIPKPSDGKRFAVSIKLIDDEGSEYMDIELGRDDTDDVAMQRPLSWKRIVRKEYSPDESRREMRIWISGRRSYSEIMAEQKEIVRYFSLEEILNMVNALAWFYSAQYATASAKLQFTKHCGSPKKIWDYVFYQTISRLVTAAKSVIDRRVMDSNLDSVALFTLKADVVEEPDARSWQRNVKHVFGADKAYGIGVFGMVAYEKDTPVFAAKFDPCQWFRVAEPEAPAPPVDIARARAFFNPDVAAVFGLRPDTPYEIAESECQNGVQYLKFVNVRGEEVWLSSEKAIVVG